MKSIAFLFILASCSWYMPCNGQPNKKVALIVGVRAYENVPPLQNSINDATDISTMLKNKGFLVIELLDPKTKREIQDGVRSYFNALQGQSDGVGLFFYSGHGMQVDGTNYLIPTQASPQIKADIDDQCVKLDYVMSAMEQAGNQLNIFILDACRNNPFRSFTRSAEAGLSMVSAPKGSYVVYATKPGSVASDGTGRNGLFTSKLIKYIDEPDLNIEQVFKRVANDVSIESNELQRPWIASDYTGDFFFNRSAVSTSPKRASNTTSPRKPVKYTLVSIDEKYGFADSTGAIVVPIQYDFAVEYSDDFARIKKGKKWSYIDPKGIEISMEDSDVIGSYSQGLAYISKYDKFGFIDKSQKIAIPLIYDQVTNFGADGLAAVSANGRWGHINTQGEVVTPIKYLSVGEFQNGFAKVSKDTKYSIVNTQGVEICRPFDAVGDFSSGRALIREMGKVGFIDQSGSVVIKPTFEQADNFFQGYSRFRSGNLFGIINRNGEVVIPALYESIRNVKEGLFAARDHGKWGFIDTTGTKRIEFKFDAVTDFSDGLTGVSLNGTWSFIDYKGKEIVPPLYDFAEAFHEGLAKVKRKSKFGFIDKTGTEVIPLKFDVLGKFENGICRATYRGKVIYIDRAGFCLIGPCN